MMRQLESRIRLSEALARLRCNTVVSPMPVQHAPRLLRNHTLKVDSEDVPLFNALDKSSAQKTKGGELQNSIEYNVYIVAMVLTSKYDGSDINPQQRTLSLYRIQSLIRLSEALACLPCDAA